MKLTLLVEGWNCYYQIVKGLNQKNLNSWRIKLTLLNSWRMNLCFRIAESSNCQILGEWNLDYSIVEGSNWLFRIVDDENYIIT